MGAEWGNRQGLLVLKCQVQEWLGEPWRVRQVGGVKGDRAVGMHARVGGQCVVVVAAAMTAVDVVVVVAAAAAVVAVGVVVAAAEPEEKDGAQCCEMMNSCHLSSS